MQVITKSTNGFTFIEIIVAITILSIIILTLYSLMDLGFSFWDYIDNSRWSYTDLQMAVGRMAKDIRSTFYRSSSDNYSFTGNMYQIQFCTRDFVTLETQQILYEYSPYDEAVFIIQGEERIPLLTQLESCNFYFYNSEYGYWDNYWDSTDQKKIPSMVRIEFIFTYAEDGYQYDFPIYVDQKGISGR